MLAYDHGDHGTSGSYFICKTDNKNISRMLCNSTVHTECHTAMGAHSEKRTTNVRTANRNQNSLENKQTSNSV